MLVANLTFISFIVFNNNWNIDLSARILFDISALVFAALAIIRFPLFIKNNVEQVDEAAYENKFETNISCLKKLIYILFTLETSFIPSFFSNSTLRLYTKGRICKSVLFHSKPTLINKFHDIFLMSILTFLSFVCASVIVKINVISFVVIDIIILLLLDKRNLLMYALSVNVKQKDGLNINVVCPYSSSQIKIFKYYGIAFLNTILITQDTFRLNPIIKDYVIAHEIGHIKNKYMSWINRASVIFNVFFVTITPYILHDVFNFKSPLILFMPLLLYLFYTMTIGYFIIEKSELLADEFAVNELGYEKCIEALNLMAQENSAPRKRNIMVTLFVKEVSFSRRIKFINDCVKKGKARI